MLSGLTKTNRIAGTSLRALLLAGALAAGGFGATAPMAEAYAPPEGYADLVEQVSPALQPAPAPQQPPRRGTGLGSGYIISPDGEIVTNNHVVENAESITVTLKDGRKFDARVVGTDPLTDVALLKIEGDADDLPTVSFADSSRLRVGDAVIAIGNPFGLGGTVTAGIISALGRDINAGPYDSFIQTDAAKGRRPAARSWQRDAGLARGADPGGHARDRRGARA